MDRKSEKTLVALGEAELSTVAGGLFDMALKFSPSVANADHGGQATSNSGDGVIQTPTLNKQATDILAAIGNVVAVPGLLP